jgi:hypothetical protein
MEQGLLAAMDAYPLRRDLVEVLPEIVEAASFPAAVAAQQYYDALIPESDFESDVYEVPNLAKRLTGTAWWATGQDAGLTLMTQAGVKAIHDTARETLIQNVKRENGKWFREPKEETCPWCRLLTVKPKIYKSDHLECASHYGCTCDVAVLRPGMTRERPKHHRVWEREYNRARTMSASGTVDDVVNAWSQLLKQVDNTGLASA